MLDGRVGFPAVAGPGFPDELPHDDDRVEEGDPEVDGPPLPLGAPHQFLVSVVPELVRSTSHCILARSGAGLPVSEITQINPRSSRSPLVALLAAAVERDARPIWQRYKGLDGGVYSGVHNY